MSLLIFGVRRSGTTLLADLIHQPGKEIAYETGFKWGGKFVHSFHSKLEEYDADLIVICRDIRDVLCSFVEWHQENVDSWIPRFKRECLEFIDVCESECPKVFRYEDLVKDQTELKQYFGFELSYERTLLKSCQLANQRNYEIVRHGERPSGKSVGRYKSDDIWEKYYPEFKFYNEYFGYE